LSSLNDPLNNPIEGPSQTPETGNPELLSQPVAPDAPEVQPALAAPSHRAFDENPPWGLKEVFALAALTLLSFFVLASALAFFVHRYRAPHVAMLDIMTRPEVGLAAEVLGYFIILGIMVWFAGDSGESPLKAIRWNWPKNWGSFLLFGAGLALGFLGLGSLLPMPKDVPMDEFFRTPLLAWLVSVFGVTMAPLLEELYFRGFLYPALGRWIGMAGSIAVTGIAFGALHAVQLGFHWAPLLILALVGIVLTTVRAITKSVASTLLMHVGYNFTLMAITFVATDGFQHLHKMHP
jgi:membrane protease YdiL (CAAX protease family)